MNFIIYFSILFFLLTPLDKKEGVKNFSKDFKKSYMALKIYLPNANLSFFESKENIKIQGKIKIFHRDGEKATEYVNKIDLGLEEEKGNLKVFLNYPKGKLGREIKKLSSNIEMEVFLPKDIALGIYLNKGEIKFKEKQERNIVIEGNKLSIFAKFSKNFKKFEALNYLGNINLKEKNLIKRYLFPFGKKIIYLNPRGEFEAFLKTIKGNYEISIGD